MKGFSAGSIMNLGILLLCEAIDAERFPNKVRETSLWCWPGILSLRVKRKLHVFAHVSTEF